MGAPWITSKSPSANLNLESGENRRGNIVGAWESDWVPPGLDTGPG